MSKRAKKDIQRRFEREKEKKGREGVKEREKREKDVNLKPGGAHSIL